MMEIRLKKDHVTLKQTMNLKQIDILMTYRK